jgi:ribosome-associated protein
MDTQQLQVVVVDALENVKAHDIVLFDTSHLTGMFDRVVIASGTSSRQTKALAASVRDKVKEAGGHIIGIEGENAGEWVLVDLGSIIVHIMHPPIRAYYQLEDIWGGREIDIAAAKKALAPATRRTTASSKPARTASRTSSAGARQSKAPKDPPEPGEKAVPKTRKRAGSTLPKPGN